MEVRAGDGGKWGFENLMDGSLVACHGGVGNVARQRLSRRAGKVNRTTK